MDVVIELDTEPREVAVPPDVAELLDKDPVAKAYFDMMSYSNKRRVIIPIEEAKTPETRTRRIEKTMAGLRDGKI